MLHSKCSTIRARVSAHASSRRAASESKDTRSGSIPAERESQEWESPGSEEAV